MTGHSQPDYDIVLIQRRWHLQKKHRYHLIFSDIVLNLPSPVEQLSSALLKEKQIQLYVKRDDLIHPELTGNKWRKLKYNLLQAKQENKKTLLTYGGAYSNHIHAVAAAGKLFGFKTIGVIRGERAPTLSPTLEYAQSCGMHLFFVTRQNYNNKSELAFAQDLKYKFGDFYNIPEGGTNDLAIKGVQEIIDELDVVLPERNYVCTACGTGGTVAGLISGRKSGRKLDNKPGQIIRTLGFPVLKNADWMYDDVLSLLKTGEIENWSLLLDYHFGGYAKYNQTLIDFITNFKNDFSLQLEPVYTGKMFYGIFDLINKDFFPKGSTIVAMHTGGLQGIKGIKEFRNE